MADPELPLNDGNSSNEDPGSQPVTEVPMLSESTHAELGIEGSKANPIGEQSASDGGRPDPAPRTRRSGQRGMRKPNNANSTNEGRDLERRVGRVEFADGALVRLRSLIRIDAESGRDILTDIDVLAIDVDGRLRTFRSILECKSGSGQSKEPDRLLWLSGLQKYLGFDRAVLVRQSVSRRGRTVARALELQTLDVARLGDRETAYAWLPEKFAHIDGTECTAAELRTDTQLKGLGHIPAELVAFLRHDALRCAPSESLRAVATLGRAVSHGGVLPRPTREVLASHATIALILAAVEDAGRLDELSYEELKEVTERALITGSPDGTHIFNILARADDLVAHMLNRLHAAYEEAGAKRVEVNSPSLLDVVAQPPEWVPRYLDLVRKLRANPAIAREILQTAELACFEALLGGDAYRAEAFNHLFTAEHRYLLNVAIRSLEAIAGPAVANAVRPVLQLDFDRMGQIPDRASRASNRQTET